MYIIFDLDDTMYEQVVPFQRTIEKVYPFLKKQDIEELYKESRKQSNYYFHKESSGYITTEKMYIMRAKKTFETKGIYMNDSEAMNFQYEYQKYQKEIVLHEDVRFILRKLKELNISVGIISNGPSKHQRDKLVHLDIYHYIEEKNVVISGDCSFEKPDKRIFEYAKNQIGIKDEVVYFIGDSYRHDIIGAKKMGWKTVWIDKGITKVYDVENINFHVHSYKELLSVIDSITRK